MANNIDKLTNEITLLSQDNAIATNNLSKIESLSDAIKALFYSANSSEDFIEVAKQLEGQSAKMNPLREQMLKQVQAEKSIETSVKEIFKNLSDLKAKSTGKESLVFSTKSGINKLLSDSADSLGLFDFTNDKIISEKDFVNNTTKKTLSAYRTGYKKYVQALQQQQLLEKKIAESFLKSIDDISKTSTDFNIAKGKDPFKEVINNIKATAKANPLLAFKTMSSPNPASLSAMKSSMKQAMKTLMVDTSIGDPEKEVKDFIDSFYSSMNDDVKEQLSGEVYAKRLEKISNKYGSADVATIRKIMETNKDNSTGTNIKKIVSNLRKLGKNVMLAYDKSLNAINIRAYDSGNNDIYDSYGNIDPGKIFNFNVPLENKDGKIKINNVKKMNSNIVTAQFKKDRLESTRMSLNNYGLSRVVNYLENGKMQGFSDKDIEGMLNWIFKEATDSASSGGTYANPFGRDEKEKGDQAGATRVQAAARLFSDNIDNWTETIVKRVMKDRGEVINENDLKNLKRKIAEAAYMIKNKKAYLDGVENNPEYQWLTQSRYYGDIKNNMVELFENARLFVNTSSESAAPKGIFGLLNPGDFLPGGELMNEEDRSLFQSFNNTTVTPLAANKIRAGQKEKYKPVKYNPFGTKFGQSIGMDYNSPEMAMYDFAFVTEEQISEAYEEAMNIWLNKSGNQNKSKEDYIKKFGVKPTVHDDASIVRPDFMKYKQAYRGETHVAKSSSLTKEFLKFLGLFGGLKDGESKTFNHKFWTSTKNKSLDISQWLKLNPGDIVDEIMRDGDNYHISLRHKLTADDGVKTASALMGLRSNQSIFKDPEFWDQIDKKIGNSGDKRVGNVMGLYEDPGLSAKNVSKQFFSQLARVMSNYITDAKNNGVSVNDQISQIKQSFKGTLLEDYFNIEVSDGMPILTPKGHFANIAGRYAKKNGITTEEALINMMDFKNPNGSFATVYKSLFGVNEYEYRPIFSDAVNQINTYIKDVTGHHAYSMDEKGIDAELRALGALRKSKGANSKNSIKDIKSYTDYIESALTPDEEQMKIADSIEDTYNKVIKETANNSTITPEKLKNALIISWNKKKNTLKLLNIFNNPEEYIDGGISQIDYENSIYGHIHNNSKSQNGTYLDLGEDFEIPFDSFGTEKMFSTRYLALPTDALEQNEEGTWNLPEYNSELKSVIDSFIEYKSLGKNTTDEAKELAKSKVVSGIKKFYGTLDFLLDSPEGKISSLRHSKKLEHSISTQKNKGFNLNESFTGNNKTDGIAQGGIVTNDEDLKKALNGDYNNEQYMRELEFAVQDMYKGQLNKTGYQVKNIQDLFDQVGYDAYNEFYNCYQEEVDNGEEISDSSTRFYKDKLIELLLNGSDMYGEHFTGKGIRGFSVRFPEISGRDTKHAYIYTGGRGKNSKVAKGSIQIGTGLAMSEKADFDGDILQSALFGFGGKARTYAEQKSIYNTFDRLAEVDANTSKVLSARAVKNSGDNSQNYNFEDAINGMMNDTAKVVTGNEARFNRSQVGLLSKYATAIRNMMTEYGLDEIGSGQGKNAEASSAQSMIVRSLFQSIEQDAINAKNVFKRLSSNLQNNGQEVTENNIVAEAVNEIENLRKILMDFSKNNSSPATIRQLMSSLTNMGIFKDGFLDSDAVTQTISQIQQMENGESVLNDLGLVGFNFNGKTPDEIISDENSGKLSVGAIEGALRTIDGKIFEKSKARSKTGKTGTSMFEQWSRRDFFGGSREYNEEKGERRFGAYSKESQEIDNVSAAHNGATKAIDAHTAALLKETEAEKNKIIVAGKEKDAIILANGAYSDVSGIKNREDALSSMNAFPLYMDLNHFMQKKTDKNHFGAKVDISPSRLNSALVPYMTDRPKDNYNEFEEVLSGINGKDLRGKTIGGRKNYMQMNALSNSEYTRYADSYVKTKTGSLAHLQIEMMLSLEQIKGSTVENFQEVIDWLRDLKKGKINNVDEQVTGKLSNLEKEYEQLWSSFTSNLGKIGYSDKIQYINEDIKYRSENIKRVTENNTGHIKDGKFVPGKIIGSEVDSMGLDINGTSLGGSMDAISYDPDTGTLFISDFKNKKELGLGGKLQLNEYGLMAEAHHEKFKNFSNVDEARQAGWDITEELFKAIKEFTRIQLGTTVQDESGNTKYYKVDYKPNEVGKLITKTPEALTEEEQERLNASIGMEAGINGHAETEEHQQARLANEHVSEKAINDVVKERVGLVEKLLEIQEKLKAGLKAYSTEEIESMTQEQKNIEEKLKSSDDSFDYNILARQKFIEKNQEEMNKLDSDEEKSKISSNVKPEIDAKTKQVQNEAIKSLESYTKKQYENDLDIARQNKVINDPTSTKQDIINAQEVLECTRNVTNEYAKRAVFLDNENKQVHLLVNGQEKIVQLTDESYEIAKTKMTEMEANQKKQVSTISNAKSEKQSSFLAQVLGNFKNTLRYMTDTSLAYGVIGKVRQTFTTLIQTTYTLDQALTDLQIASGNTRKEMVSMSKDYNQIAQQMGRTTQEVMVASNDWLRAGYEQSEVLDLTTNSMKLSTLGMIESSQATEYLISVLKGWKLQTEEVNDVVDKLVTVDLAAAASSGEIALAMSRANTSAQLAGVDINKYIGYITTLKDVSQKSAESVGESTKTMFARYGNIKAGKYTAMSDSDNTEEFEGLNDVETVLSKIQINIRSSALEFRSFDDVLADIAKKWKTLSSVDKNAVAGALGGVRQRENILVLLDNYDRSIELAKKAENANGTANKKMAAYNDSLAASQKRVTAALEEFVTSTPITSILKTWNKGLEYLIKNLTTILLTSASLFLLFNQNKLGSFLGGGLANLGTKLANFSANTYSLKNGGLINFPNNFKQTVNEQYGETSIRRFNQALDESTAKIMQNASATEQETAKKMAGQFHGLSSEQRQFLGKTSYNDFIANAELYIDGKISESDPNVGLYKRYLETSLKTDQDKEIFKRLYEENFQKTSNNSIFVDKEGNLLSGSQVALQGLGQMVGMAGGAYGGNQLGDVIGNAVGGQSGAQTGQIIGSAIGGMAPMIAEAFGINPLIGGAIAAVGFGVSQLVETDADIAKKAEEAQKSLDEVNEKVSTSEENLSNLTDNQTEFERLAQGINQSTGGNLSLSNEDYQSYQDILQNIIDSRSDLYASYDEEGNLILKKNGMVLDSNKLMQESINLAKQKLAEKKSELVDDEAIKNTSKVAEKKQSDYEKDKENVRNQMLDNIYSDIDYNSMIAILDNLSNKGYTVPSKENQSSTKDRLKFAAKNKTEEGYLNFLNDLLTEVSSVDSDVAQELSNDISKWNRIVSEKQDYINSTISTFSQNTLGSSEDFQLLDVEQQSYLNNLFNATNEKDVTEDVLNKYKDATEAILKYSKDNAVDFWSMVRFDMNNSTAQEINENTKKTIQRMVDASGLTGDARKALWEANGYTFVGDGDGKYSADDYLNKAEYLEYQLTGTHDFENGTKTTKSKLKTGLADLDYSNLTAAQLEAIINNSNMINNELGENASIEEVVQLAQKYALDDREDVQSYYSSLRALADGKYDLTNIDDLQKAKQDSEIKNSYAFTQMESMAESLGIQIDELILKYKELGSIDIYGNNSQTAQEVEDDFTKLGDIANELSSTGKISAENYDVIVSDFSELLPYATDSDILLDRIQNKLDQKKYVINASVRGKLVEDSGMFSEVGGDTTLFKDFGEMEQISSYLQNHGENANYKDWATSYASSNGIKIDDDMYKEIAAGYLDSDLYKEFLSTDEYQTAKKDTKKSNAIYEAFISYMFGQKSSYSNENYGNFKKVYDDIASQQAKLIADKEKEQELSDALSKVKSQYDAGKISAEQYIAKLEELKNSGNATDEQLLELAETIEDARFDDLSKKFEDGKISVEAYRSSLSSLMSQNVKGSDDYDKFLDAYIGTYDKEISRIKAEGDLLYEKDFNAKINNAQNLVVGYEQKLNILKAAGLENSQDYLEALNNIKSEKEEILNIQKEQLEYEKSENDKVLSAVNTLADYETNKLEKQKDKLVEYYDKEIEKLEQVNEAKEDSIELERLKQDLENAKEEKSRVYTSGLGWTYQTNQAKVQEAKQNLDDYYDTQRIDNLKKLKDAETKVLDDRIEKWNEIKEQWEQVQKDIEAINALNLLKEKEMIASDWDINTTIEWIWKSREEDINGHVVGISGDLDNFLQKYKNVSIELNNFERTFDSKRAKIINDVEQLRHSMSDVNNLMSNLQGASIGINGSPSTNKPMGVKTLTESLSLPQGSGTQIVEDENGVQYFYVGDNQYLKRSDGQFGTVKKTVNGTSYGVSGIYWTSGTQVYELPNSVKNNVKYSFSNGLEEGYVSQTGLAMLHGTPSKPEYVMNNDQAWQLLKNFATLSLPKGQSVNDSNKPTQYVFQGDINLPNVQKPNEFFSELMQTAKKQFSITKKDFA